MSIDWIDIYNQLKTDIIFPCNKWKSGCDLLSQTMINEFVMCVLLKIEDTIKILKFRYTANNKNRCILDKKGPSTELAFLKRHFVLCPIDKASKNIGIICKTLYRDTISKELDGSAMSHEKATIDKTAVASKLKAGLNNFGFNASNVLDLPFMYCSAKFHKNPVKFRFIIASSKCATKALSKRLCIILKKVQQVHKFRCKRIQDLTGFNRFWIIDNNKPILDCVRDVNAKRNARNIETTERSSEMGCT